MLTTSYPPYPKAYRPVDLWTTAGDVGEDGGRVSGQLEPATEAVVSSDTLPTLDWDGGAAADEEEEDLSLSFRWWSWYSHISEWLRGAPPGSEMYEEVGGGAFAGGAFGDIWRARRRCPAAAAREGEGDGDNEEGEPESNEEGRCDGGKELIVKRLRIERGHDMLEAGLREVYFGELLSREAESSGLFTTYVDHFFRGAEGGRVELWIVYENAGELFERSTSSKKCL